MSSQSKATQKIAWITGASSGIGRALCLRLAQEGWIIAVTARNVDALIHLQDQAPKNSIHCYPGDVANSARMKDIMGQIMTHLGRLDCVVMAAGVLTPDNAQVFNADRFRRMVDTNICGAANVLDPVLSHFNEVGQGQIVFMGSLASYTGLSGMLSYSPTKAAIRSMAQSLSNDLVDTNIKVQLISPGFVATPFLKHVDTGEIMPMDVDTAVDKIIKGMRSSRFDICFPMHQALVLRAMNILPQTWVQKFLKRFGY